MYVDGGRAGGEEVTGDVGGVEVRVAHPLLMRIMIIILMMIILLGEEGRERERVGGVEMRVAHPLLMIIIRIRTK